MGTGAGAAYVAWKRGDLFADFVTPDKSLGLDFFREFFNTVGGILI